MSTSRESPCICVCKFMKTIITSALTKAMGWKHLSYTYLEQRTDDDNNNNKNNNTKTTTTTTTTTINNSINSSK